MRLYAAAAFALAFASPSAFAACTTPAGNPGDIVYSSSSGVMAYCNGTNWISMGLSSPVSFGTLTNGYFCTATGASTIACNTQYIALGSQVSGVLPAANGGTGVANTGTITLGGNLTTSGAYPLTFTTTGATSVTLPTSGTLVNTGVTTLSSLVSIGTITTGTWNGTAIGPTYGGTGLTSYNKGDILYGSASNVLSALPIGTSGYILTASAGGVPVWSAAPATGVTSFSAGTTGLTPNTATTGGVTLAGTLAITNGGTGQTTAAAARASTGLDIDQMTTHGDSAYTILATDRTVTTSTALTAARTWTLPAASAVNAGQQTCIADQAGGVTGTNTLTISRAGSDTIDGATSYVLNTGYQGVCLVSDGSSKWTASATTGTAGATTGTGTTNYTARWTGATTLGTGTLYDNGTIVGVGTTSGSGTLNVYGPGPVLNVEQNGFGTPNLIQAQNLYGSNEFYVTNGGVGYFAGNLGIGSTTPGAALTVTGVEALNFGTDYSTTGTQNNVNLGATSSVRYTGAGVATFTGIIAGTSNVAGEILTLHNASTSALTLSNQNTNSTILNRIITGTGADLVMAANSSVIMQYDGSAGLWRVIGGSGGGIPAGTTGQVQFNSGSNTFAAGSNLTWDNTNFRLGIGSAIPTVGLDLSQKTDAIALPIGTSGSRPTCSTSVNGALRYNSTIPAVEACVNGAWVSVGAGGGQLLGVYASSCGSGYSLTCGSNYSVVFTGAAGSVPSFSGSTLTLASNTAYVTVETMGGGGGGGNGSSCGSACGGGGGGGGGAYAYKFINNPSGTYYYAVGAAGASSCFGTNTTACTTAIVSAVGGSVGGTASGGSPAAGGAGGLASSSVGDVTITGSAGGTANAAVAGSTADTGGTGGSAARGGGGGDGGVSSSNGSVGAAFGGGGGGGGNNAVGAAGGPGGIIISAYSSGSTQAFNLATQATGTLGVANGGTGTTTPFTQGSVVFSGASGVYSQDNSNFFYDATNHRLGIGTTTPLSALQVNGIETLTFGTDYSTTGTQNNVNVGATSSVRYTGSGVATFTGIITGTSNVAGEILTLHNASTSALTLSNQNASSTILNRIITGTGSDLVMASNSSVIMQYDGSAGLWRVIGGSGGGSTSSGTVWSMIASTDIASAVTSYTFSGLNGDSDGEYMVVARIVSGASSAASYTLLPNADTTAADYGYQTLYGGSTTAGASQNTSSGGIYITETNGAGGLGLATTNLYAKSGQVRTSTTVEAQGISGTTVSYTDVVGASWNNTASNITSLQILASVASGLGVGTHLELWSKRSVGGSGGTPGGVNGNVQFNNSSAFGGTNNLFWDNTNTFLGVGTATPATALDVAGTVRATAQTIPASGSGMELLYSGGTSYLTSYNRSGSAYLPLSVNASTLTLNASSGGNVGIGSTTPGTALTVTGAEALNLGADLTTTGSQNNVNVGATSSVRYSGSGVATFTGIIAGTSNVSGEMLTLHNASTSALTLSNQNASSTASNRIITGTGSDLVMAANSSVIMQYDGTASVWRVIGGSGGSGGSATVWSMIASTDITTAVSSYTFSGLSGDTDGEYMIVGRFIGGAATSTYYMVQPNADTSGSDYGYEIIYANGSSAAGQNSTAASGLYMGYVTAVGHLDLATGTLYAKSGYTRTWVGQDNRDVTGTTIAYATEDTSTWTNTATAISSLVVTALSSPASGATSVANGLGVGTHLELWAKRSVGGSGGTTTPGGTTGQIQYNNASVFGGTAALTYAASGTNLLAVAQNTTDNPLAVRGMASQSGDLTQWQNSGGTPLAKISAAGDITTAGKLNLTLGTDITTTGSQNNVNVGAQSSVRYSGSGTATFTGIITGTVNLGGTLLTVHNASSSALTISNQNTSSTASNRIVTGTGADMVMAANSSVVMQYDGTASLWRVIGGSGGGIPAGTTGQVQFNSGSNTFAAGSNLTWDNTNFRLGIGSAIPTVGLDLSQKTDAISIPVGTQGQRPTCSTSTNGLLRYNSTTPAVEACVNGAWVAVGAGGGQLLGVYSSGTAVTNAQVVFTGAAGSAPSFSGSTLTLASNTAYIVVELWGAGGGGGGGGNGGVGGTGGTTYFSASSPAATTPLFTATGGGAGSGGGLGGAGGVGASGTLAPDVLLAGSASPGTMATNATSNYFVGGIGGSAPLGGGGGEGGYTTTASVGAAFGGGGGGGGMTGVNGAIGTGGGGGGGGYALKVIYNPSSTYYYTVSGGGSGGAAGTSPSSAGGAGGAGGIKITAYSSGSTQAFNVGTQATGTLGVANGGTGTTTPFTQGSVVFSGASGVYTQDNSNFFYDATNHRLGLGTTNPAPTNASTQTPRLVIDGASQTGSLQVVRNTSVGAGGSQMILSSTRGSSATSYTALQSGDGIGTVAFDGTDGTQFLAAATITAVVNGTVSTNNLPTDLTFGTSSGGANSSVEKMRITSGGSVGIGTTGPDVKLTVYDTTNVASMTPGAGASGGFNVMSTNNITGLFIGANGTTGNDWIQAGRNDTNTTVYSLSLNPAGGNVGIGTVSPAATLESLNASALTLPATSGTTESPMTLRLHTNNSVLDFGSYSSTGAQWMQATDMSAGYATHYPLLINPNGGNVGIGTTGPTHTLDVTGTLNVTGAVTCGSGCASGPWSLSGSTLIPSSTTYGVAVGTTTAFPWNSSYSAIQLNSSFSIAGGGYPTASIGDFVAENAYVATGGWKYGATGPASVLSLYGGAENIRVAPSGSAGAAITWTPAFMVDNAGFVGIGTLTTNPTGTSSSLYGEVADIVNNTAGARALLELWSNTALTSGNIASQINFINGPSPTTSSAAIASIPVGTTAGTGNLVFFTSNTAGGLAQQMTLTSTGSLGIGTSSPALLSGSSSEILAVEGATNPILAIKNTTSGKQWGWYVDSSGSFNAFNASNASNSLSIGTSGNVGIGVTSPNASLHIANSSSGLGQLRLSSINSGTDYAGMDFYRGANASRHYSIYYAESPDDLFVVNASQTSGVYLTQSATSWGAVSDARLKNNIQPVAVLDSLKDYRAVTFDWKNNGKHDIGVVAQELYRVFPEMVDKGSDTGVVNKITDKGVWGVHYEKLGAVALEGVKELKSLFDGITADVRAIEDHLANKVDPELATLKAANDNQAKAIDDLRKDFEAYKKAHP